MYTEAIELHESAIYFANRSFAYSRTEFYGYALNDASKAISLDPNYIKGYYRRASAYMALGKFKLALKDFATVSNVRPKDEDARNKYKQCQKICYVQGFNNAISVAEKASALDGFDLSTVIVEEDYTGPHLTDEGKVTEEFMLHLMDHYKKEKKLHRKYAIQILKDTKEYMIKQSSLVDISVPNGKKFTVCGDVHGQFYDLMNIFDMNGLPSEENPYLFNGDFVDRGSFSVECIFTLLGFKLLYPNHFYMSRGNHETENMNQMYGFEGEVKAKYNAQMTDMFTEVFNWLPLCHIINARILVMHGGIFNEDNVTLDDIRKTERNRQPPDSGIMCDLLWSDPQLLPGRAPSKRGVGCQFGPDITAAFCKKNDIDYIIRSHEVKDAGYEVAHNNQCVTVFSAPNYCDSMKNRGAYITLTGSQQPGGMKPQFTSFKEVPHPNVRAMAYANSLLSMLA